MKNNVLYFPPRLYTPLFHFDVYTNTWNSHSQAWLNQQGKIVLWFSPFYESLTLSWEAWTYIFHQQYTITIGGSKLRCWRFPIFLSSAPTLPSTQTLKPINLCSTPDQPGFCISLSLIGTLELVTDKINELLWLTRLAWLRWNCSLGKRNMNSLCCLVITELTELNTKCKTLNIPRASR